MFNIPGRGSPGCALVLAAIFSGLIGFLFLMFGFSGPPGGGDIIYRVFMSGIGFVAIFIAVVLAVSGFKKPESPQSLFSSDMNPMERATRAKTDTERELGNKDVAEASRKANQLTSKDRQVLDKIRANILTAPTHDEVVRILSQKRTGEAPLANPLLQPIAFAIKPTTTSGYVKGFFLEALIWAGVIFATPFFLIVDAWEGSKTVLHKALRWSRRARRYRVRPHKVFRRDGRAPVLYLRSFSEDYEESLERFLPTTAEEKLVGSYNRYGPVIAIGKPTEELPLLGASRIYFDDATWQAGVLYLMSISQLTIIQAGIAPGLLWELGVSRQRLEPQRLIISFAAWEELDEWNRHLQYLRFKKYAEELLECDLPSDIRTTSHLAFEEGWTPKPYSDTSFWRRFTKYGQSNTQRVVSGLAAVVLGYLVVLFATSAVRLVIGLVWGNSYAASHYSEGSAKWVHYNLGTTGMSMDLPAAPSPVVTPLATDIEEQTVYGYNGADMGYLIGYFQFSDNMSASGEMVLQHFAKSIGTIMGGDTLSQTVEQVDQSKLEQAGKIKFTLDGRFRKEGRDHVLRGQSFEYRQHVWFILIYYDASNETGGVATQRILDSVKVR